MASVLWGFDQGGQIFFSGAKGRSWFRRSDFGLGLGLGVALGFCSCAGGSAGGDLNRINSFCNP